MSNNDVSGTDAQRLADAFSDYAARWAVRAGATPAAAAAARNAARAVSLATSSGHVCTRLEEVAGEGEDLGSLRQALVASGVVGIPSDATPRPLVLDAEGRVYLRRYFEYEQRLARRLRSFADLPPRPIDTAMRDRLAALFDSPDDAKEVVDWQRVAAALALRQGLTIVSGGPGTGKTTTVANLLACLIAQDPACRVVLAAPTGKAAARMSEALRERALHLPEHIRERLPAEAFTIHRLLKYNPSRGGFQHNASNPLLLDVLVVDEASMLDVALATRLLDAVPAGARVVLLGDKDQLAAVESGAVFSELCADPTLSPTCQQQLEVACGITKGALRPPSPRMATGLQDCVVWLQRNYRFAAGSGIGRLAAAVNAGLVDDALQCLREREDTGVVWHEQEEQGAPSAVLDVAIEGYRHYLDAVLSKPGDSAAVAEAFGGFRVLCAQRQGPQGVEGLNEAITRHAREVLAPITSQHQLDSGSSWFPGRPVMVLVNDYAMKLFNGDIGITLLGEDGALQVFFPLPEGGWRAIPPVRLPAHETAFAMTVHKSQGSEFGEVLLVLPGAESKVLTRELLYTGLTRARRRVQVMSTEEALRTAIGRPTRRHTGLISRLHEGAPTALFRKSE